MSESQATHYGGAFQQVVNSSIDIVLGAGRIQGLDVQAAGLSATLPDATQLPLLTGSPVFFLMNLGSESIAIRNKVGQLIATIPTRNWGLCVLADNTTIAGEWYVKVKSGGGGFKWTTITTPPPTTTAPPTTLPPTTTTPPPTTTTKLTTPFGP